MTPWLKTAKSIEHNIALVRSLLKFDKDIVDVAVGALDAAVRDLEERKLRSATTPLVNRAQRLKNLATNESLRPQYEAVFNQCVVLLVSYFSSGLHTLLRVSIIMALRLHRDLPVHRQTLEVSWRSLERSEGGREAIFTDLLIAQLKISFQDMKSISRAFRDCLDVMVERDLHTDNIIIGQAARHAMEHAGAVVDARMMGQVSAANRRTIKHDLEIGQPLRFTPSEVEVVADSMTEYLKLLCLALDAALGDSPEDAVQR